jgi:hypothetical protein
MLMKSFLLVGLLAGLTPMMAFAQSGQSAPPAPPIPGRAGAPVDLTGTWVSVVSEDWRWRMTTPLKGDAASIPYKPAARRLIDAWDPEKDTVSGLQCKAYGAPAIMRLPGRVRISWQDENTLKIELDQGHQTRLFHFGSRPSQAPAPSWQGYSTARWEPAAVPLGNGLPVGISPRFSARSRSLEVATADLREGYLRKNGVPYSDKTTLTEYYDLFQEPNGDNWFTVTTIVTDPVYLYTPFVTTTDFKKEADGRKFSPAPCAAR